MKTTAATAGSPRDGEPAGHLSSLGRDSSCCQDLNWRCDVSPRADAEGLQESLLSAGYHLRCNHPALRVFRFGTEHELAWVVSSGRIQIRVGLDIPQDQRCEAAQGIYQRLGQVVAQLEKTPGSIPAWDAAGGSCGLPAVGA